MRIERLTDNRIKVTLTTADLMHLDINIEQLTPDSKELHTFLFHIMETIREETDFNPYSGQVVVEATPSSEGISILVSKMQKKEKHITREQFENISSVKPKVRKRKNTLAAYYFNDFENMCSALSMLQPEALKVGSLFRQGNRYYIFIKNEKCFEKSMNILSEFAKRGLLTAIQELHIREHWTMLAEGDKLVSMAEGIAELEKK